MNYTLDAGFWNSVMAVPNCVVDEYIKLCSGDSLKVLLYLLRHGGDICPASTLCEKLGIQSEAEVEDAAEFWIQRGLISACSERSTDTRKTLVPAKKASPPAPVQYTLEEFNAPASPAPAETPLPAASSSLKKISSDMLLYYSSGEIAERIRTDEKISYLFKESERMFGHALKGKEMQTVIALTDTLGLPVEVAVMLISYCIKIDKATPAYMLKTAQDWIDNGINTLELADQKIAALERQNSVEEALRKEMELKTKFTAYQLGFIRQWSQEWGFDNEMIMLAYEATVNNVNKMSFPYCNKILENWHLEGIKTREALEKKADNKSAASQGDSSFDMDDVMAQILNKYKTGQT